MDRLNQLPAVLSEEYFIVDTANACFIVPEEYGSARGDIEVSGAFKNGSGFINPNDTSRVHTQRKNYVPPTITSCIPIRR